MKVLLINPPYSKEERYGKSLAQFGPENEPLGLAYLAAALEKAGHDVKIWDGMVQGNVSDFELHWADVFGVTIVTPAYYRAKELIQNIKRLYPDKKVIVGGPHPTLLPEETLKDIPEIDYLVVGEGENAIVTILDKMKLIGDGPNIYWNNIKPEPNIDNYPMPARHLLPMDKYQMTRSRNNGHHAFTVIVARGCPFKCQFCSRIHGRKVRFHSVERVIQEMEILIDKYGAKEINLEADTITLNKKYLISLCAGIMAKGLHTIVKWTCESRVDTVDREMLQWMKDAGCWQISYGVETGSQRLLDLIQKGITLEQVEKTFKITKEVGINIRGFFMLGIPTETREESEATINFARKLDPDWAQFTLYTPFPGTGLYDMVKASTSKDWSEYRTHGGWTDNRLSYVPEGRTMEEMKWLQKKAYRSIYLRPKKIWNMLLKVNSIHTLKSYIKGFLMLSKISINPKICLACLLVLFTRIVITKDQNVLTQVANLNFKELKTNISILISHVFGHKLIKVDKKDLQQFAEGNYVDSPVYFNAIWPIRKLNWSKLKSVLSFINNEDGTVLDFGCGNGVLLPSLSKCFKKVIGIDLHIEAAKKLIKNKMLTNVYLYKANGLSLPIQDNSIDVIFATSSLEHIEDIHTALYEINRVLKPKGKLIFLVPSENWFYRLGRKVFGYVKPKDHYWTGNQIKIILSCYFRPEKIKSFWGIYDMGKFRKV